MGSETGRGAQVRLDDTARQLARGGAGLKLIDSIRQKQALEAGGTAPSGNTPDGSLGNGVAADDEVLTPGGAAGILGALTFTAADGGVARSMVSKVGDVPSLKDYGAVGDGTTDDTAAVTLRNVAGLRTYVPAGTYSTTIGQGSIQGLFFGPGQIKTSDGNKRGYYVSQVNAAPSTTSTLSSILSAFNGDYSKSQFAVEHRITGSATLGQPTSSYRYVPEAYPFVGYLYNTSGWNQSTSGNSGRTAACFFRVKVDNYGQGDAAAYNAAVFVAGAKSGATSFLANPAGSLLNGNIDAGAAGIYLNAYETAMSDNGYDVAGCGWVINMNRSNATGALGCFWSGYRSQSTGSQPINTHFSGSGKADYGLDLVGSTFGTNKAAIVMQANDRIYLASTNADATHFPNFTVPGATYLTYTSATTTFDMVVGGTANVRVGASTLGFYNATPVAKPTGVAVTAAGVHAALVSLGLIAA